MSFWTAIRIGASGMSAQRLRMDLISNNIANAETTRTAEGGPYKRQDVVFMPKGEETIQLPEFIKARRKENDDPFQTERGVKVAQVVTDEQTGARVYDPTHPDADEEGFVTYPNVNIAVEMTNMLSASRSYEANLAVVTFAKQMAQREIDIGR